MPQRKKTEISVKYSRENSPSSRSQKNGKVFAKLHSKSIFVIEVNIREIVNTLNIIDMELKHDI